MDNAAGYELCGHDKNGLGCTWKKEILDTVVVVGLGGFCSKLLLRYAPMLSTTSYMYYALLTYATGAHNGLLTLLCLEFK